MINIVVIQLQMDHSSEIECRRIRRQKQIDWPKEEL